MGARPHPRGLRPPPLSPELQARIESPENAAHVLVQALYLLPGDNPLPQKYPVPDKPGELRLFETESGSIARALDIWAPDDAPEIAARIEQCRPALDKAREAFDAPYFLFPAQDANVRRPMLEILVLHFRIACRHAWEIRGEQETAQPGRTRRGVVEGDGGAHGGYLRWCGGTGGGSGVADARECRCCCA